MLQSHLPPFTDNKLMPLAPTQPAAEPVLRQYIKIALRRRWVILAAVLGCLALGLVVTLLMSPKYTATATIEILRESGNVTNIQGVEREANIADQEFYQTQYGLLVSRVLAEKVVEELGLANDRGFFQMFGLEGDEPEFELVTGRYRAQGRQERARIAADALLKNVAVDPVRLSRLVYLRFTSRDPGYSAKVANSWSQNFIKTNLERKVDATAYGRNLLERELAKAKEKLDASQRQLVGYATAEGIITLPAGNGADGSAQERSLVADTLSEISTALSKASADRIEAEARFRQAGRAGASSEALDNAAINSLRARRGELAAEYQKLMQQFEPQYPAALALQSQIAGLDRAIAAEENRVSSSLRAGFLEAQQREQALAAKVADLKGDYLDQRRRSIQYNIFQQEVDTNRALYDGLLQRFKEIGVANGVGVNNISVVDPALVPERPSSPRLLVNLIVALIAGLGLGGLIAFALEQVDETIADPVDIDRLLNLPLLGAIPKITDGDARSALADRKSHLVDAYLTVQTNLSFATEHGVPAVFAVTSTKPAEGKSTTAISLATTLARAGKRVVLMDGDMRSPSVHNLGNVKNDRGLSNYLSGQDDIEPLLFRIDDLDLTAIAAGPIPPNAAELLTGNRFNMIVAELGKMFDHVIIDAPPVMGLADAPLIASKIEAVVFVIEPRGAPLALIQASIERLRSAHANLLGCVLTKYEPQRTGFGYEYSYGFGYGDELATNKNAA